MCWPTASAAEVAARPCAGEAAPLDACADIVHAGGTHTEETSRAQAATRYTETRAETAAD